MDIDGAALDEIANSRFSKIVYTKSSGRLISKFEARFEFVSRQRSTPDLGYDLSVV